MRVIGIIGPGYSGSTMLSFMLGSLPGCKTAGEDYRILDPNKDIECFCCPRGECQVFRPGFRYGLDYGNVWERLADMLDTESLIVSDKLPFIYKRYLDANPDVDISFVLPYKRPEQFVHSSMGHDADSSKLAGLQFWRQCIRGSIEMMKNHGSRHTTCSLDDLTNNPVDELRRVAEALALPFDPGAVEYWNHEHHDFGGNWTAHLNVWGEDDPRTLEKMNLLDKGWGQYKGRFRQIIPTSDVKLPFTREEIAAIYEFPGVLSAYDDLVRERHGA